MLETLKLDKSRCKLPVPASKVDIWSSAESLKVPGADAGKMATYECNDRSGSSLVFSKMLSTLPISSEYSVPASHQVERLERPAPAETQIAPTQQGTRIDALPQGPEHRNNALAVNVRDEPVESLGTLDLLQSDTIQQFNDSNPYESITSH